MISHLFSSPLLPLLPLPLPSSYSPLGCFFLPPSRICARPSSYSPWPSLSNWNTFRSSIGVSLCCTRPTQLTPASKKSLQARAKWRKHLYGGIGCRFVTLTARDFHFLAVLYLSTSIKVHLLQLTSCEESVSASASSGGKMRAMISVLSTLQFCWEKKSCVRK